MEELDVFYRDSSTASKPTLQETPLHGRWLEITFHGAEKVLTKVTLQVGGILETGTGIRISFRVPTSEIRKYPVALTSPHYPILSPENCTIVFGLHVGECESEVLDIKVLSPV